MSYVWLTVLFAGCGLLYFWPPITSPGQVLIPTAMVAVTTRTRVNLTVSKTFDLSGLSLYLAYFSGMGLQAVYSTLVGITLGVLWRGRLPLTKWVFNVCGAILWFFGAHLVFTAIGGIPGTVNEVYWYAGGAFVLTFFLLNMLVVSLAMSLEGHHSMLMHLRKGITTVYKPYLLMGFLSVILSSLWITRGWAGFGFGGLLLILLFNSTSDAINQARRFKDQLDKTILVLATALGYRDPYTHGHSGLNCPAGCMMWAKWAFRIRFYIRRAASPMRI